MEHRYSGTQIVQGGKELADRMAGLTDSVESMNGLLQEYVQDMTSPAGVFGHQEQALSQSTTLNARIQEEATTILRTSQGNCEKIRGLVDYFTGMGQSMGEKQKDQEASNENIRNLSKKINEISDFVKSIQDVSEQTNLLSFNASIEAARAGNAGKGFRIIANEVKNLSDRTTKLSNEIDDKIREVQKQVQDVVNGNITNNTFMNTLMKTSIESNEKLGQINEAIEGNVRLTEDLLRQITDNQQNLMATAKYTREQTLEQAKRLVDKASRLGTLRGNEKAFIEEMRTMFQWLSANKDIFTEA